MKRLLWSAGAAMALIGCATSKHTAASATAAATSGVSDTSFRDQKPDPLPRAPHFQAPVPEVRKLANGATLLVVESHALPLVSVQIQIRVGVDGDPQGKPGMASFTLGMLDEGTEHRSALQLATELEDLAAELSSSAGPRTSRVSMNCLVETLPKCLELLADVVVHPAFTPADMERVRALTLTDLSRKKGSPSSLASDEMSRLLYGEHHPWGQPEGGTPRSVRSMTRGDLVSFHQRWFRPNNATVVVAGDITAKDAQKLLDEAFATWKPRAVPHLSLPSYPKTRRGITLIDRPGTTQSQVWVAGRVFGAQDSGAVPLRVANYVLGGLFTSRLNMNLREVHGYSYGVRSHVTLLKGTGLWMASGGIVSKNTADAVVEYQNELRRFSDGTIRPDELIRAKEAYIRALPALLETNDAVAAAIGNLDSLGLKRDYYRTLPTRIEAVTPADIAKVVKSSLRPADWPMVVVGPKDQIEQPLRALKLGPFNEKTPDPLTAQR